MPAAAAPPRPEFDVTAAYPEFGRVRNALAARDWAGVRTVVDDAAEPAGRTMLVRFAATVPGTEAFLRDVLAGDPDEPVAGAVLGGRLIKAGWDIRTSVRAQYVSPEQFRAFHEHLDRAEQVLIDAAARHPADLAVWCERLVSARGLQLGLAEVRRRYDRLAAHDPHHLPAQWQLLQSLCPKWSGSWEQMHAFARACMLAAPKGAPNAVVVVTGHLERWIEDTTESYLNSPFARDEIYEAGRPVRRVGPLRQRGSLALSRRPGGGLHPTPRAGVRERWRTMIRRTEVDGVPTVIAPTSGPMHAGLMFRVGRADETLARFGVTHLLEHLVLHPLGLADYHYNGATGPVMTYFHMRGPEKDVAGFLSGVCAALEDLPLDRLETEKEILRTESSSRNAHVTEPMALWRYGARDHGLVSFPEWGLSMITADDLKAWAARYFTRDNAVLWIGGRDVPAGLTLRLPAGERRAVPIASSVLPVTPAYFAHEARTVALDAVVRRRTAAVVYTGVLERELFRGLRQEGGLSYTAAADYQPRGDGRALITAVADALPEKQDAVLGGFVDILAKLRVGRIDRADVEAVVAKRIDSLDNADAGAAQLPSVAFAVLSGEPQRTTEELVADLRTVSVADVHEVAGEAHDSALLMVPEGRRAEWAGFAAAPTGSATAMTGWEHRSLEGSDVRLVAGTEGVGLVGGEQAVSVRFDGCAAVLCWPDGRRTLIGEDAISLTVEPTLFARAAALGPDDELAGRRFS